MLTISLLGVAREVVAFHKQHLQQQSERLATAYGKMALAP